MLCLDRRLAELAALSSFVRLGGRRDGGSRARNSGVDDRDRDLLG